MEAFVAWLDPLAPFDEDVAKQYGTQISLYAAQHGLKDMKQDDSKDSVELNQLSSIVEMRLAKHLNVYPNFQLDGPTHVDLTIDGTTIDIKWTDNPRYNMSVRGNITPQNAADYFVLLRGQALGQLQYVGWIGRDEFFEKAEVRRGRSGLDYRLLYASDLHQGPIPISNETKN